MSYIVAKLLKAWKKIIHGTYELYIFGTVVLVIGGWLWKFANDSLNEVLSIIPTVLNDDIVSSFLWKISIFYPISLILVVSGTVMILSKKRNDFQRKLLICENNLIVSEQRLQRIVSIDAPFRQIAMENTVADVQIFRTLYASRPIKIDDYRVNAALSIIYANIRQNLDHAAGICATINGIRQCRATLKLISSFSDLEKNRENTKFIHTFRDKFYTSEQATANSMAASSMGNVGGNTASIETLLNGQPFYVENNLPELAATGKYKNDRNGWDKDYTATFVVPVFILHDALGGDEKREPIGVLAVDTLGAFIEIESMKANIQEISWRLSALIHRFHFLTNDPKGSPE